MALRGWCYFKRKEFSAAAAVIMIVKGDTVIRTELGRLPWALPVLRHPASNNHPLRKILALFRYFLIPFLTDGWIPFSNPRKQPPTAGGTYPPSWPPMNHGDSDLDGIHPLPLVGLSPDPLMELESHIIRKYKERWNRGPFDSVQYFFRRSNHSMMRRG